MKITLDHFTKFLCIVNVINGHGVSGKSSGEGITVLATCSVCPVQHHHRGCRLDVNCQRTRLDHNSGNVGQGDGDSAAFYRQVAHCKD